MCQFGATPSHGRMATRTCCRWFKEQFKKKKKKSVTVKDIRTGVSQVQLQTCPPVIPGLRIHLVMTTRGRTFRRPRWELIWFEMLSSLPRHGLARLMRRSGLNMNALLSLRVGWSGVTLKRRCWSSLPRRSTRHQPADASALSELVRLWCIHFYYYNWTKKRLLLYPFVEEKLN